MAQNAIVAAKKNGDLFEKKPESRGRPKKAGALTNAERQAKYRAQRVQVDLGDTMSATVRRYAQDFDLTVDDVVRELVRFALTNRNWERTGF